MVWVETVHFQNPGIELHVPYVRYSEAPQPKKPFMPVILMSLDERRELVRRVWEEAVESIAWDGAGSTYADGTVEQFIEREKL